MLKHTLNYLFGKGLPGIINFIAIAVYTRILTPDEYGVYVLVLSTVTLINTMFFHWLRLGLLRFNPKYTNEYKNNFLSSISAIFVCLLIIFVMLGTVAYFFVPNNNSILFIWLLGITLLIMQSIFDLFTEYLRSELLSKTFGIIMSIKVTISLALAILFINLGLGSKGIILGLICGILTSLIFIMPKTLSQIRFSFIDKGMIKEIYKYSLPFIVMLSMEAIIFSTDRFLISWMMGIKETGLYSVSYDLAKQILLMIMMIINLAAYPLVIKALEQSGVEACRNQLKKNATYLLLFSVPAMIALVVLSDSITSNFLGEEFRYQSAPIFALVAIAIFLQGFKMFYFDLAFQLGKNTKLQIIPVVLAVIVNLILNLILIPQYSVFGAAYSTIISYILSIVCSGILGNKVFNLGFPGKQFIKIFSASSVMGLILWLSLEYFNGFFGLLFQILLGLVTYTIMVLMLKIVNLESLLVRVKSKI